MEELTRTTFEEFTTAVFEKTIRAVAPAQRRGAKLLVSASTRLKYEEAIRVRLGSVGVKKHLAFEGLSYGPALVEVDTTLPDNVVVLVSPASAAV